MLFVCRLILSVVVIMPMLSCAPVSQTSERNAFLTLAETFGVPPQSNDNNAEGGSGSGDVAADEFRGTMAVTLANNNTREELNTSFVAWVNVGSIRSADQQDALLRGGYVQLTREVRLGLVFTLPPGTFVFNGPGVAGATAVTLNPAQGGQPSVRTVDLVTPDVFLVFSQPPVSCDSVAFFFTVDGEIPTAPSAPGKGPVILFGGATGSGVFKTLAQIQTYQCEPLQPGFFLKVGGGTRKPNEFFEGENLRIDFNPTPNANGDFAVVTIS